MKKVFSFGHGAAERMTVTQARWRLQLLAELSVGQPQRQAGALEDAQYTRLKDVTSGHS